MNASVWGRKKIHNEPRNNPKAASENCNQKVKDMVWGLSPNHHLSIANFAEPCCFFEPHGYSPAWDSDLFEDAFFFFEVFLVPTDLPLS